MTETPTYHAASSLSVRLVASKADRRFDGLTVEEWETLWLLEHRGQKLPELAKRTPEAFSFAVLQRLKQTRIDDLTPAEVARLAAGEAGIALEETAGDRRAAGAAWHERQGKREDNRKNGGWGMSPRDF